MLGMCRHAVLQAGGRLLACAACCQRFFLLTELLALECMLVPHTAPGQPFATLSAHPQTCLVSAVPLLLQDVRAHLPAAAHSLYYKDIIGNISSSDTTHTSKEVSWARGM